MPKEIDTMNKFLVGFAAGGVLIMHPPRGPMSDDDALLLAAYLVSMTSAGHEAFSEVLKAVENC